MALLPGLFASFGVTAVLIGAAVLMLLLASPMVIFGQETSGRNMEDLGTEHMPVKREVLQSRTDGSNAE